MPPTVPQAQISQFIPLLVLMVIAVLLASVLVVLSWFLGPKKPSAAKLAPYECGVTPVGSARERFPVKYYLIAMLFIIFDIETVFLYPWAVTFTQWNSHALQVFSFIEMIIFIIILFVGYIYVWKKGAFEWE
jgi:NADH-quinone oxidoreductase subunit A